MTAISPAGSRAALHPPTRRLVPLPHSARIVDAVLAGFVVVRISLIGGSIPTAQLALVLLVAVAAFRRPTRSLGLARWFPWLALVLIAYAALETLYNGVDPLRRAANIVILAFTAAFMASGRIDVGSVIKGLGLGLAVNVGLFYLHLAPNDYDGRLTGLLQDPNAAGLYYAVGTILLTVVVRRVWLRAGILVLGALAVVDTGSRTGMAAYAAAVIWLCCTQRLGRAFQVLLGAALTGAFVWANLTIAQGIGVIATDRAGSDALRARIDAASLVKTAATPWYGDGLAQGVVHLEGATWFFNSSYEDLIVEGGVIFAVGILLCYVLAGFGMRARSSVIRVTDYDTRVVAAATLVVFYCASRLGEVFLSPAGFLVLGVGLANLAVSSVENQGVAPPARQPWYREPLVAGTSASGSSSRVRARG
ncbi:hypothetical protein [Humibacter ginsenosidimutans]|uniref:hypothetical protein n=1 Tax=Humibacter ginsenosidimutans TaxID=2599293 RepID=UPI00143D7EBB|nr:hypothetical protein [Humibacter ginsenosidimutans]